MSVAEKMNLTPRQSPYDRRDLAHRDVCVHPLFDLTLSPKLDIPVVHVKIS